MAKTKGNPLQLHLGTGCEWNLDIERLEIQPQGQLRNQIKSIDDLSNTSATKIHP